LKAGSHAEAILKNRRENRQQKNRGVPQQRRAAVAAVLLSFFPGEKNLAFGAVDTIPPDVIVDLVSALLLANPTFLLFIVLPPFRDKNSTQ